MDEELEKLPQYIDIFACDFSFRRPGFAYLRYHPRGRRVVV